MTAMPPAGVQDQQRPPPPAPNPMPPYDPKTGEIIPGIAVCPNVGGDDRPA